jgi:hypothetical protein
MERKRLLIACGVITLLAVVGVVIVIISMSNRTGNSSQVPTPMTVTGNLTCLPHSNTQPGQPVTLECATGLKTADGRHYALLNLSSKDANTDFSKQVTVSGDVVPPSADERYDIEGTIVVKAFTAN